MATLSADESLLRRRFAGHLRRIYAKHEFKTQRAMADRVPMNEGHLSSLMNGITPVGLSVAWRVHKAFNESLDYLLDSDPPEEFMPPEHAARAAEPVSPYRASRPAQTGRHRKAGGK